MPPYWGLGFQLCRYGYRNLTFLESIWDRNRKAEIPQDVQYIDIDYMEARKDFSYNQTAFKELPKFVQKLHDNGQKLVLILDPGIASRSNGTYDPKDIGLEMEVFIKGFYSFF